MIEIKDLLSLKQEYNLEIDFFGAFSESERKQFSLLGKVIEIEPTKPITNNISFDDKSDEPAVYLVLHGTCLIKQSKHGDMIYAIRAKGDLLFEYECLFGSPSTAHMTAMSKIVLFAFPSALLKEILKRNPLAAVLAKSLAHKLDFHRLKGEMAKGTVALHELIIFIYGLSQESFLNNYCEVINENQILLLPIWSVKDLSRFLGWKEATVTKNLQILEDNNWIQRQIFLKNASKNLFQIVIKDLKSLKTQVYR